MVAEKVLKILGEDMSFPAMLKARKMDKENFKAPYPYRDDGQLIWDAIYEWVEDYLKIYYGKLDGTGK